jgi:hypothetical protein
MVGSLVAGLDFKVAPEWFSLCAAGCRVLGVDPNPRMAGLALTERGRGRGGGVRSLGPGRPGIRCGHRRAGLALGGPRGGAAKAAQVPETTGATRSGSPRSSSGA